MSFPKLHPKTIIAILLCSTITACMVGPDYYRPPPPCCHTYNHHPMPHKTVKTPHAGKAGVAQHFLWRQNIAADWWRLFHSPGLNYLICKGLENNPDLESAKAALRQAQEAVNVQIGNTLFPAVDALLSAERQRVSAGNLSIGDEDQSGQTFTGFTFNLFTAELTISYTFDFFGGARREIESLKAQVCYQEYQLLAAYITLTSNIVTNVVTMAQLQAQLQATHALLQSQEEQLAILKKQQQLGGISMLNVLTQETLVAQTRATIPPLEKSLSQTRHALLALVGDCPNQKLPEIKLDDLVLPKCLPVSLASDLVRQRPDVLASEALLHSASAQIGVATAQLFPQFTLTGFYGWQSSTISGLFSPDNNAWSLMGQMLQPIFHGGALLAQRREAIAAYAEARAQYRQTVLQALQNVADSLRAIETDARTLRDQKLAEASALENLNLTQKQYRLGGVDYLNLLNAQEQYQETRINVIEAKAARYSDTAALFQALGGGWWNCRN